ncbi:DUF3887 domain-containing protein [Shewanella submarina]|uniref:DUF3887 domain-containing protein n=1 Tax=Shewanella submarina TaxID=2016376 RepID=A0ABV7GKR7_9GAMM|nr:DUF3887 domain-containing protein [Shewanella submarina]MCL1036277.1 DUF3887 domain-containing protein [Shewanella submarina]
MQNSNIVIILLLVLNLCATIWFGALSNKGANDTVQMENITFELPKLISEKVREDISSSIIENFNDRNYEELYNIFGPAAKAQISKEKSNEAMRKMVDYFDSIFTAAYTHSEKLSQNGDTQYLTLYYTVKLSERSKFGQSGTLKVTLAVRGNEYEIYGFRINAEG